MGGYTENNDAATAATDAPSTFTSQINRPRPALALPTEARRVGADDDEGRALPSVAPPRVALDAQMYSSPSNTNFNIHQQDEHHSLHHSSDLGRGAATGAGATVDGMRAPSPSWFGTTPAMSLFGVSEPPSPPLAQFGTARSSALMGAFAALADHCADAHFRQVAALQLQSQRLRTTSARERLAAARTAGAAASAAHGAEVRTGWLERDGGPRGLCVDIRPHGTGEGSRAALGPTELTRLAAAGLGLGRAGGGPADARGSTPRSPPRLHGVGL